MPVAWHGMAAGPGGGAAAAVLLRRGEVGGTQSRFTL